MTVFIKSKEDSKTSLKDWLSLELEDIVTHCCIKNAMHNKCIYIIIVFGVTYRPNGPGVSLSILCNIL